MHLILALTLLGASGDAIYAKTNPTPALGDTAAKRNALGALANAVAPALDQNTFSAIRCINLMPGGWACMARRIWQNITAAQKLDLVLLGTARNLDSTDGDEQMPGEAVQISNAGMQLFTNAFFGANQGTIYEFTCTRAAQPPCSRVDIVTASPTTWNTDRVAGNVIKTLGKAP